MIILNNVDVAQTIERALRMREFRAAMPRISRASVNVFAFCRKTIALHSKSRPIAKKLITADWPKHLRDSFTRGESPNGRWLALLARARR